MNPLMVHNLTGTVSTPRKFNVEIDIHGCICRCTDDCDKISITLLYNPVSSV